MSVTAGLLPEWFVVQIGELREGDPTLSFPGWEGFASACLGFEPKHHHRKPQWMKALSFHSSQDTSATLSFQVMAERIRYGPLPLS